MQSLAHQAPQASATGAAAVFELITPTELARAIGLSRSRVANWKIKMEIPAFRVPQVAHITGLPMEVVRPEMFDFPRTRG